jgi:glycosyltransferase involved in cell wall biosynthesis
MSGAVVFGSVPFAAPWLTEHNLAAALGRRMPVDWVDPVRSPLTRRRPAGAAALPVRRPVVLPPISSAAAQALSQPLLALQLRPVAGRPLGIYARGPATLVDATRPARSVYLVKDWTPAGAALIGRSAGDLEDEVLSMCRRVDVVCAVTEALRATLRDRGVESRLLRHGFAAEQAGAFADAPVPAALRSLPRPLLGYVGRLDDRLHWEAIRRIAERHRDAPVVLNGPVSPRLPRASAAAVEQLPNVAMPGPVARAELPAHLAALDVLLLPYREDTWGAHGSPLKLWEYLYAGAPIVASGYEVLREYAGFVDYGPADELPGAVERALASGGAEDVARRRRFALANTWDHRVEELLALTSQPAMAGATAG